MSFFKANQVQVGTSGTASNNFHWRNLLDGLIRLSRGNIGDASPVDVIRVKADNSVEFPGGIADGVLGAGQAWQVMSRAWNTTYTNTTGRPIEVIIIGTTLSGTAFNLNVESGVGTGVYINVGVDTGGVGLSSVLSCIVPSGHRYKTIATGTPTLLSWLELR